MIVFIFEKVLKEKPIEIMDNQITNVVKNFKSGYHKYFSERSKELKGYTSREACKIIGAEWKQLTFASRCEE